MKDWFKARNIWGAAMSALSDEEAGRLAKAIWAFTMNGEVREIEGAGKGILAMILLTLGQDAEKDDKISEVRAIAGKKGGLNTSYGKAQQRQATASNCDQLQANDSNCSIKNKNKNKNQNKEQESEKNIVHLKRIATPTVEDVKAYCDERGVYLIDPQQFVDYYEARGWILTNGKKMVDFKAAVRLWEKNERERQKKSQIADLPY